jgi:3-oxoacyl-[acyl-carrier-protein] synthase II
MRRRVVITGIGVVAPNGASTDEFWQNCLDQHSSVQPIPVHWHKYWQPISRLWAPLPAIDFSARGIGRVEQMQLDKSAMLVILAAQEALESARLPSVLSDEKKNLFSVAGFSGDRTAVFMGTGIGGIASFAASEGNHILSPCNTRLQQMAVPADALSDVMRAPSRFNPFIVPMTMPNSCSAMLGIRFSFTGPNRTVCTACASGTMAIGQAFEAIAAGSADAALAGGAEYLADDYGGVFRGFDIAKTLVKNCDNPETANRPFDRKRSGFLFAEGGGAVLVLEELSRAQGRGAPVIAEVLSFAETFDAHSVMSIDASATQIRRMMIQALGEANVTPGEIDYINTHGTGTEQNDEIEAMTIESVFGARPLINATKSLTGHTIGAAGAIEAAVTALSIARKTTHACKNLEEPVRPLNFVTAAGPFDIRTAFTQSFAFGGHNAGLVLREVRV